MSLPLHSQNADPLSSCAEEVLELAHLPIFVINLDDSRNRWIQCHRRLTKHVPPGNIQRVPAIDGRDFFGKLGGVAWSPRKLRQLRTEGYVAGDPVPDPVRTALCLSHQRALRMFLENVPVGRNGEAWALIIEDDVRPAEAMFRGVSRLRLNIPPMAEVLFLHDRVFGDISAALEPETDSELSDTLLSWRPVTGGIGLEAYLVSTNGARRMLEAWKPLHFECDVQLMSFSANYGDYVARAAIWDAMKVSGRTTLEAIQCHVCSPPLFQIDEGLPSVKFEFLAGSINEFTTPPREEQAARPCLQFHSSMPIAFAMAWFNPFHYRARVENLLRTLENLEGCNLAVVELAFGEDDWQLPDDTPNLLRLRSNTICWQKEALLNFGLEQLDSAGFEYLGWIDADVVFETNDWQQQLLAGLGRKRLCQIFETVATAFPDQGTRHSLGAAASWEGHGRHPLHCGVTGFGWAMHRDVWRSARLYDQNILGGGDHVMWRSVFYDYVNRELLFGDRSYSEEVAASRNQWASLWSRAIEMKVGYAKGVQIVTLPHGKASDRKYMDRGGILVHHGYSPTRDVVRDNAGLWRWTEHASSMLRSSVSGYFEGRREDDAG